MLEQIFTLTFFTAFLTAAVRMAVPLIYAALGEVFLERAGILNIGMEGVMLSGAILLLSALFMVAILSSFNLQYAWRLPCQSDSRLFMY